MLLVKKNSEGGYIMSRTVGEIEVNGEEECAVDWRIRDCLSLLDNGKALWYTSPQFSKGGERWVMRLLPDWIFRKESESVDFRLDRIDRGPRKTFKVKIGLGSATGGGVENKTKVEREIAYNEFWLLNNFFSRSSLVRKMPDSTLVVRCTIKSVGRGAVGGGLPPDVLVIYPYKELQTATQNFCDLPLGAGGCKIGEGAFGKVYRAVVRGEVVAVKRLKVAVDKQFMTELNILTNYKHENLLPLLGCSLDPTCCLLYEYMPNGSLQDRLACADQSRPLTWQTRLSISYGSALGINHLHTFGEEPVVHRDVKSANILLDQNLVPKVGDFGLVRTDSSGESSIVAVTERFLGTRGYMPREAFMGDVSVKWDTFSFGVVLLELLTGLPPYDTKRKHRFLIAHIENCEDIRDLLDPKAEWNTDAVAKLYRITQMCLTESKKSRPTISEILEDLRKLSLLH